MVSNYLIDHVRPGTQLTASLPQGNFTLSAVLDRDVPVVFVATASATPTNPLLWYATRAAAVSAYVTLAVTVMWGIVRSLVRVSHVRSRWAIWLLDEVHPFLELLPAAFVALHSLSLVFDPLIPFSLLNLLLPLGEPYRPVAVALGVLALYGLAIVLLSSWLRRYISHARWRALHYTSFAVFALVTLHGLLAGSDAGQPWMRMVYLAGSGVVAALVVARILWPRDEQPAGMVAARSAGAHHQARTVR